MVYGIDQCRKCGNAMPPAGPLQAARHEQAKHQRPTMPEAEWRAQGWKAAPTRYQLHHKMDGMCEACRWAFGNRVVHKWRLLSITAAGAIVLFVFVYIVGSVFQ